MADWKAELQKALEELQTQRDELEVRLHLAKAEAKDEWAKLEKKLEHLKSKLGVVSGEARDTAHEVGAALELVAAELKKGYERIKKVV